MATKYSERRRRQLIERANKWMAKGKSTRQAAEKVGVPRSTLRDWLNKS